MNQKKILSSRQIDELLKLATLLEKPCFDESQKQIIAYDLTQTFNRHDMTSDEQLEYLKTDEWAKPTNLNHRKPTHEPSHYHL